MSFLLHLITVTCILLPTIVGYNLVFGKGKIFHFGQIGLQILAAYPLWISIVLFDQYPIMGLLLGLISAFVAAWLLAWLSFRLDPDGLGVMSIAVHLSALNVVLNWQSVTRGALGVPGIPRWSFLADNVSFAIFVIVAVSVWCVFVWLLDRSAFGRKLQALSEHDWYAEALGISRKNVHIVAFLVAAGGALLTGVLLPQYLYLLSPTDFAFPAMIFVVMCVVAGKPGSMGGAILATALLMMLKEGLRLLPLSPGVVGPVRLLLFGLILLGAVWYRRDALFPPQREI
ncbi:branched-chain amino acid ABC transporter permease [Candidatus Peregrinibacteria bacterium]|nr:branched-chain amino acid ABC transporter permease [Candidatus Peregrinibacteria bacterium]